MTLSTVTGTHLSSFTPHSFHPLLFNSLTRHEKKRTTMACSKSPKVSGFCQRRAILFVSVLPLIQLKAKSLESLEIEEDETDGLEQKQEQEIPPDIFSLLNGVGIISAGVLCALYALARNENSILEATIESMKIKLKKSEEAIVSLEKAYDLKLANERDVLQTKLESANEDKRVLTGKLYLVIRKVVEKWRELKNTQKLVDDLNNQIENLQPQLVKAGESNEELEEKLNEKLEFIEVLQEKLTSFGSDMTVKEDIVHDLDSSVAQKDLELVKLNSTYKQIKDELRGINSATLRWDILEKQKQLSDKSLMVDDLNAQVSSLVVIRDDLHKELDRAHSDYDDLKASFEEKSTTDTKLLEKKELEIHQLIEKIDAKSKDLNKNQVLVSDLIRERDEMKITLDIERKKVEIIRQELKSAEELLGKSRNEVSDREKKLEKSRNLCSDLEGEIYNIQVLFCEAKKLYKSNLDEAKRNTKVLSYELATTRENLENTKNKKRYISQDLKAALEKCNILENELVDVYKKFEKTTTDLKEEKNTILSLTEEKQVLGNQLLKDKESRKPLEMGLEETTKSLDEMNRNALILSKELEIAKSQISTLEAEKEMIFKTLDKQKRVNQEAQENAEVAQNFLMRFGEERESLKRRDKDLEKDLAAAKGEILRLRSEMNNSKRNNNDLSVRGIESEKETKRVVNTKKVESEGN